jgi:hypothetical protein
VQVKVLIPKGHKVKAVHLVRARRTVPSSLEDGYVVAQIPHLHIAEIVHVELA